MRRVIIWSADHPWLILLLVATLTFVAFLGALRLRVDPSPKSMMIHGNEAHRRYLDTLQTFGTDNIVVVFVRDPELFTPRKLSAFHDLVFDIRDCEHVIAVESIFTARTIEHSDGMLHVGPAVEWPPESMSEAERLRERITNDPLLSEHLVSRDGQALAVNVFGKGTCNLALTRELESILAGHDHHFEQSFQLGMSTTCQLISENIFKDQQVLIPLSVTVLLLALYFAMTSTSAFALPLLTAGGAVIWTAGFMGFMGMPINLLTVIAPSLLIVVGSTEDIHMLHEYMAGIRQGRSRMSAIRHMAPRVGPAILLTGVTTIIGFFAITIYKIEMLRMFGMAASFGLFANFTLTVTLAPAYLRLAGPTRAKTPSPIALGVLAAFQKLGEGVLVIIKNFSIPILVLAALMMLFLGASISRLKVDNDLLGYFHNDSPIKKRSNILHDNMSGAQAFLIRINGGYEEAFKGPNNLARLLEIQRYINSMHAFDATQSLADYIALMNKEMHGGDSKFFNIPRSKSLLSQYLLLLHRDDINRWVTPDFKEAAIMVRHNISSSYELNKALDQLASYMNDTLDLHFNYYFTGKNILLNTAADSMASSQALSLLILLTLIVVLISILFTNVKAGFIILVPNLFPILCIFGFMGLSGIPLNTGTAMVAAIAIGVAVDDTLHMMVRFNMEVRRLHNQKAALIRSIRGEVRPVLATTIALMLGFTILGFSNFMPVRHFGLLSAAVVGLALLADLFITPILLSYTRMTTLWDMLALKLKTDVLVNSHVFKGFRPWQIKKIVLLSRAVKRGPGDIIIEPSESGQRLYILLEGHIVETADSEQSEKGIYLATYNPGDVFGETALINACSKAGMVKTTTWTHYLEIDLKDLQRLRMQYPRLTSKLLLNLCSILGHRLNNANTLICRMIE